MKTSAHRIISIIDTDQHNNNIRDNHMTPLPGTIYLNFPMTIDIIQTKVSQSDHGIQTIQTNTQYANYQKQM